jgi:hypothetical protein
MFRTAVPDGSAVMDRSAYFVLKVTPFASHSALVWHVLLARIDPVTTGSPLTVGDRQIFLAGCSDGIGAALPSGLPVGWELAIAGTAAAAVASNATAAAKAGGSGSNGASQVLHGHWYRRELRPAAVLLHYPCQTLARRKIKDLERRRRRDGL